MIMYKLYAFHARDALIWVFAATSAELSVVLQRKTNPPFTLKYILLFMARTSFEAIELLIDYLPAYIFFSFSGHSVAKTEGKNGIKSQRCSEYGISFRLSLKQTNKTTNLINMFKIVSESLFRNKRFRLLTFRGDKVKCWRFFFVCE